MAENILGEPIGGGQDHAALCEAAIRRASHGDWRAAAWWLENSPTTRGVWGDAAIREEFSKRVLAQVIGAIADANLPIDLERRVLLHLQARVGALPSAEAEP